MTSDNSASRHDNSFGLCLYGLRKQYGDFVALHELNLEVPEGQFLTILGPSGSGKTTILRSIAGFLAPDGGRVVIGGRDVTRLPPAQRSVGMVFQNYALFPHMTAAQNIGYGLKLHKWDKGTIPGRVDEMLSLVDLQGFGHRYPKELSGGQQQRVAFARALAFKPRLLLMDEPLGALDRELRMRMARELRRIHREVGGTALYVTHDREEALTLSDEVALMRKGRLDARDSPEALFHQPSSEFVATFFGGHNVFNCDEPPVEDAGGRTATVSLSGRRYTVGVGTRRAAEPLVRVAVPEAAFSTISQTGFSDPIPFTVAESLFLGENVRITVELERLGSGDMLLPPAEAAEVLEGRVTSICINLGKVTAV